MKRSGTLKRKTASAFKAWMENHHPEILAADFPIETAAQAIERLNNALRGANGATAE